jgi:hypothetical protein
LFLHPVDACSVGHWPLSSLRAVPFLTDSINVDRNICTATFPAAIQPGEPSRVLEDVEGLQHRLAGRRDVLLTHWLPSWQS